MIPCCPCRHHVCVLGRTTTYLKNNEIHNNSRKHLKLLCLVFEGNNLASYRVKCAHNVLQVMVRTFGGGLLASERSNDNMPWSFYKYSFQVGESTGGLS